MIEVAVAYGFGNENRYNLEEIPPTIQLSLYKYELYEKYKDELFKQVKDSKTEVKVLHLPIDCCKRSFTDIYNLIKECYKQFGCYHYVVHPNKGIEHVIRNFDASHLPGFLCIENFNWRSNKFFRTPLAIAERCYQFPHQRDFLRMTFDTSHADEVWFDHRIMPFILKHTSVIHLSNRAKGIGDHMPFNDERGKLNLVYFVKELTRRYHWSGVIVLEHMEEYKHKTMKAYNYLKKLIP